MHAFTNLLLSFFQHEIRYQGGFATRRICWNYLGSSQDDIRISQSGFSTGSTAFIPGIYFRANFCTAQMSALKLKIDWEKLGQNQFCHVGWLQKDKDVVLREKEEFAWRFLTIIFRAVWNLANFILAIRRCEHTRHRLFRIEIKVVRWRSSSFLLLQHYVKLSFHAYFFGRSTFLHYIMMCQTACI